MAWTLRLALALLVVLQSGAADAERSRLPFAAHDIRLGTALGEFRRASFLEDSERAGNEVVCSSDPNGAQYDRLKVLSVDRPGAIRCMVFGKDGTEPTPIELYGESTQPVFIFYPRRPGSEPVLTLISIRLRGSRFFEVVQLLQRTFGPPSDYELGGGRNLSGTATTNATYRWQNGASSISAENISADADLMGLVFTYDEIWRDIVKLR